MTGENLTSETLSILLGTKVLSRQTALCYFESNTNRAALRTNLFLENIYLES